MSENPDKIGVIGALTIDVNRSLGKSYRFLGGGGFYSSISLARIDVETFLFTAYGPDMNPEWVEQVRRSGVKIYSENIDKSIVFENVYQDSSRLQKSSGEPTRKIFVGRNMLRGLQAVHVTPVLNEVDQRMFQELVEAGCRISIDAQGFVRRVGDDGYVRSVKRVLPESFLKHVDYVHMNIEEQMFFLERDARELLEINPEMIIEITDSENGSIVMDVHKCFHIPAFETNTVDPTGAGDVYASVFLAKHIETRELLEAGLYASASASIKVEKTGPFFSLDAGEVEHRFEVLKRTLENLY